MYKNNVVSSISITPFVPSISIILLLQLIVFSFTFTLFIHLAILNSQLLGSYSTQHRISSKKRGSSNGCTGYCFHFNKISFFHLVFQNFTANTKITQKFQSNKRARSMVLYDIVSTQTRTIVLRPTTVLSEELANIEYRISTVCAVIVGNWLLSKHPKRRFYEIVENPHWNSNVNLSVIWGLFCIWIHTFTWTFGYP